jgi:hypothetical protein
LREGLVLPCFFDWEPQTSYIDRRTTTITTTTTATTANTSSGEEEVEVGEELVVHKGRCHCGAVQFEVSA